MGRRALVVAVWILAGPTLRLSLADAQSPSDFAATAAYAVAHQNADGGFAPQPGMPSTIGATSTALRVLNNVGGSVPDVDRCIQFVRSCKVPGSGFTQSPGGNPDVITTAVGLMAAAELKVVDQAMSDDAVAYFGKNAKAFEEVRMAIAGLEAVGTKSPDFPRWLVQLEAMRQPDGSSAQGPGRAFESGGIAAAILRMGLKLEKPRAVVATIKAGQRPEGAWSKDDGPADLSSSYRVMRALFLLKEKPDVERLRGFIARCQRDDGSYANTPEGKGALSSTYFATSILRWLQLLEGQPALPEPAPFTPLLRGTDLAGWEGNRALWSVRDQHLVGKSAGLDHNEFLATRKPYGNFILSLRFRLVGGKGNSGVQFRSVRVRGTEMSGYQADIGEHFWGRLYDESRRDKVLARASDEALKTLRKDGWNHYVLFASDDRVNLYLNGAPSVVYREESPEISRDGLIALQIHSGEPMEIEFKDIQIRVLP
jgi:hypothetical protein